METWTRPTGCALPSRLSEARITVTGEPKYVSSFENVVVQSHSLVHAWKYFLAFVFAEQ
jgi:hypothetical protein